MRSGADGAAQGSAPFHQPQAREVIGRDLEATANSPAWIDAWNAETARVMREHRATWWVYAGDELIRHTAAMRGTWGYEVKCSCGWQTRTGCGLRRYCQDQLDGHRAEARSS